MMNGVTAVDLYKLEYTAIIVLVSSEKNHLTFKSKEQEEHDNPKKKRKQMIPVQMFYDMENIELTYPQGQNAAEFRKGLAKRINTALKDLIPKYALQHITICANKKACDPRDLQDIQEGAASVEVQVTHNVVPKRDLGLCDECSYKLGPEPNDRYLRKKEVADRRIIEMMMSYAHDHPGASMLLVTSDRDFRNSVADLVNDGYTIIVATETGHGQVAKESNYCFKWEDLQQGRTNQKTPQYVRNVHQKLKRK